MNEEVLKKGVVKSFEVLESTKKIIFCEMMDKARKVMKMLGEEENKEEERNILIESMKEDVEKMKELGKILELKEECIKLFDKE